MSQEKIIRRIRKCLSLSESNNPHEAAAALRQAKALMDKHNIDETFLDLMSVEIVTPDYSFTRRKLKRHVQYMVSVICAAMNVRAAISPVTKKVGNTYKIVQIPSFYGIGSDAEIAAYTFEVINRQMEADRKEYLSGLEGTNNYKTKMADAFCQGWVLSVYEKVQVFANPMDERKEALLDEWKAIAFPKIKKAKSERTRRVDYETYNAMQDGSVKAESVYLHQATTNTQDRQLKMGTH